MTDHDVPTPPEGGWAMQEYFNEAVRYLASMTRRSEMQAGDRRFCMYRTEEGSACVVGHFVPNGHPLCDTGAWGQVRADQIARWYPGLKGIAYPATEGGAGERLAQALQNVHDCSANWVDGGFHATVKLRGVAEKFGLDGSCISQQKWAVLMTQL